MKQIFFLSIILATLSSYSQLKPVTYTDGNQKLNGFVIAPEKKTMQNAGVLILPAWKGIDDHSKETAEKLSKLGYFAFVADIYGEGNYPKDTKEAGEKSGFYKTNFMEYRKRIRLALEQLVKSGANPDKIVVIGYCFGGTGALEAVRGSLKVKGAVSFHGGLGKDPARYNNPIEEKVLILHGADDPFVSENDIKSFQKEMRDGNADWQMIYYADAVHAFTEKSAGNDKSKGVAYNEKADKRSWQHLLLFLQEALQ